MGRKGPRTFDPVAVGNRETDAWAAYYRHEWRAFLVAAVGMVAAGFGMDRRRTLAGTWRVHREHQHDAGVTESRLTQALVDFYSYVYDVDPAAVLRAARWSRRTPRCAPPSSRPADAGAAQAPACGVSG